MATWLVPALKAVLPHIGSIIEAARPVFTNRRADSSQALQQQVAELQSAAEQNAAHVKELAAQLQSALAALEHDAALAEARLQRLSLICLGAAVFAAIALGVSVFVLLFR
jgi:hypothetical protein